MRSNLMFIAKDITGKFEVRFSNAGDNQVAISVVSLRDGDNKSELVLCTALEPAGDFNRMARMVSGDIVPPTPVK